MGEIKRTYKHLALIDQQIKYILRYAVS